ncbi:MAG: ABC transporter ATP-binding protein [Magnetococcales bacterium]|nr:ABC transporter ATP-binding protein [Magnetococcales bacterium]
MSPSLPWLLELDRVSCAFAGQPVLRDVSLHLRHGEMAAFLGPSGCGKTTLLRAIAGFIPLSGGSILREGAPLSAVGSALPPEKRRIGMVFQDYALFPHLTVSGNVGFGLRGMTRGEAGRIVDETLERVGLSGLAQRYPHELSGGQQQRVALARALAPGPGIILLDEPFSNLDVDLRGRLAAEVREILVARHITGILVTHDQQEAFTWGDKVGVLQGGVLQQWGDPFDIYHEPVNRFVATFVEQGAFLSGVMESPDALSTPAGRIQGNRAYPWPPGTPVDLLLRPDDAIPDPESPLTATVVRRSFRGAEILYSLRLDSGEMLFSLFPSRQDHAEGDRVGIRLIPDHLVIFPRETSPPLPPGNR